MAHRKLKKEALALLRSEDLSTALLELCRLPARRIVNPLFGLLYNGEPIVRWRAVTAMGAVVSKLADEQPESARVIMRRFLWNLNDESGGIGWGSPEAMGEIMARNSGMAAEYACMLISYADPCGNYLEHPVLQQGVLWALGRLGRARPEMIRPSAGLLIPWLRSADANHRGLAAWTAQPLKSEALADYLAPLCSDPATITIYLDGQLAEHAIGRLARIALRGA
jgi:hypothetical protein